MHKLSLGACALLSVLFASPAMADDIVVAAAGPMTGGQATFGRQMRDGAEQAIADINAAGGVLARQLRLEIGDHACDPKQARSVAEKLSGMGVAVAVGHYCSSSSIPASDAYVDGNVLQITPASTNPLFTDRGLWNTFRTCGRDDQQGGFAAAYLAKNFKGQEHRHHQRQDHLRQRPRRRSEEGAQRGRREGEAQRVLQSGRQGLHRARFQAQAQQHRYRLDGGYHQEAGLIVRQMRDQGLQTILMAGDALATREFASITGPAGEGVLITFPPDPRKRPTAAAVVKEFKDKGIDPEGYVLYTYAAYQVWAQAAAKAGTIDPQKVAATMRAGTWDTVLGPISFDKKGDIIAVGWAVYRWDKDGNYDEITEAARS